MSSGASRFSGAARLAEDTRQRFLAEIVARVPIDRLVEVHLFPPIRQGGVETGVAVVAARLAAPAAGPVDVPNAEPPAEVPGETAASDVPLNDPTEAAAGDVVEPPAPDADAEPVEPPPPPRPRLTVFTARYRLTLKGPDRGKWDADVVAEAEAPLVTVEAVVRGVQRRAGDAADPDRLGAEAVAKVLGIPQPSSLASPSP